MDPRDRRSQIAEPVMKPTNRMTIFGSGTLIRMDHIKRHGDAPDRRQGESGRTVFRGWYVVAGAFSVVLVGFGGAYTFSAFVAPTRWLKRETGSLSPGNIGGHKAVLSGTGRMATRTLPGRSPRSRRSWRRGIKRITARWACAALTPIFIDETWVKTNMRRSAATAPTC